MKMEHIIYPSGGNSNALARLEQGRFVRTLMMMYLQHFNAELKIWDGLKLKRNDWIVAVV